jgi:hypothetical protein
VDHLSHDLVFGNDGVDRHRGGQRAVVTEKSVAIIQKPASAKVQPTRLDGIILREGSLVNEEFPPMQLHLLARETHDAFDNQLIAVVRHDDVASLGSLRPVGQSVHQKQITRLEAG